MTYRKPFAIGVALLLTACGASSDETTAERMVEDTSEMTASDAPAGDTGSTTGTIRSLGPDGDYLTIDHEEIDGIGMGAMTMGFDIMSDVDLSGFEEDDRVAFTVKHGRDGSYRITQICKTQGDETDCLN
ncbi:MAG: copper-binding protein [Pseudomonadota bacterium]